MKPLISLITPVYNTKAEWLEECLESIINQTFTDWELCLCDNGSESYISEILEIYRKGDQRVHVTCLSINEGGYKGLQEALNISTGQYVGLLDSDDTMPDYALKEISESLINHKSDVLYTNEMICDINNNSVIPFLKPEYNKNLLCFLHYFGHLTLYRSSVIKRLGIRHYGGSYDYDLALRVSELQDIDIYHIPQILYHYRTYLESTSAITRDSCVAGALQTLQEHLDLKYKGDGVASQDGGLYKVTFKSGEVLKPDLPSLDLSSGNHLMRSLFKL